MTWTRQLIAECHELSLEMTSAVSHGNDRNIAFAVEAWKRWFVEKAHQLAEIKVGEPLYYAQKRSGGFKLAKAGVVKHIYCIFDPVSHSPMIHYKFDPDPSYRGASNTEESGWRFRL